MCYNSACVVAEGTTAPGLHHCYFEVSQPDCQTEQDLLVGPHHHPPHSEKNSLNVFYEVASVISDGTLSFSIKDVHHMNLVQFSCNCIICVILAHSRAAVQ